MSDDGVHDRRQARTRQAVRTAFAELLFEKNYPAVTMAGVAARANIGRSTLYEHFRTKTDLLSDSMERPMWALASVIGSRDVPAHLGWWLQHLREKQALARVLFYAPARDVLQTVLAQQVESRLVQLAEDARVPVVPTNLLATQIAAAQFAIVIPWILGRVPLSHAIVAEALHRSGNGLAHAMLRPSAEAWD
jgi:AcrR family transcriptional regulator